MATDKNKKKMTERVCRIAPGQKDCLRTLRMNNHDTRQFRIMPTLMVKEMSAFCLPPHLL